MILLRTAARILTGSTYAILGWEVARAPGQRVEIAADTLAALRRFVPLPGDDESIVRGNGAVQAVGGLLLALGLFPRVSAAVLAISMVPTTVAGHGFWQEGEPEVWRFERIQFQKNLAMLGGLAFACLDDRRGPVRSAGQ
ncbi:DoxX family membrane protein [Nocardia sp. alder85J]|uniref:DoxX family membrane protein n=1 Tax=Nocardia sp. alder85J TaxID=2862949 RepID=UPI001CD5A7F5|nr:DoxX family membrane protein [Nocardia sp. alder85J]MCX4098719.1 DoxX family membrane protein [Nocardia sp. alder85J]